MKHLLITLLTVCLCLTACSGNTSDKSPASSYKVTEDITVSLDQDSYPLGTETFTVTFTNNSQQILEHGADYMFQYYDGNDWINVETVEFYAFDMMAYIVQPGESRTLDAGTWFLQAPLQEGRYRIVGSKLRVADNADGFVFGGDHTEFDPYILEFDITGSAS